jgi:hypothetical protein
MISKIEFCTKFHDFFHRYDMSLSQASAIVGVSRLRVYLYLTGMFRFNEKRETEVINRIANYILLQKLRNYWRERTGNYEQSH